MDGTNKRQKGITRRRWNKRRRIWMDRVVASNWRSSHMLVHRHHHAKVRSETDHAGADHTIHHWLGVGHFCKTRCNDIRWTLSTGCFRRRILRIGSNVYGRNRSSGHSRHTRHLLPTHVGDWYSPRVYTGRICGSAHHEYDLYYDSVDLRRMFHVDAWVAAVFGIKRTQRRSSKIIELASWQQLWPQHRAGSTAAAACRRNSEQSVIQGRNATASNQEGDSHLLRFDVLPANERHQCRDLLQRRYFRKRQS